MPRRKRGFLTLLLLLPAACGGPALWRPTVARIDAVPGAEGERWVYAAKLPVRGLALRDRTVYVTHPRMATVDVYTSTPGSPVLRLERALHVKADLGKAVAASDDALWIATADGRGVLRVDPVTGDVSGKLETRPETPPVRITAIAWQPTTGWVWALDTAHHRLLGWDPSRSNHVPAIERGRRGRGPLEFNYPSALAVERNGGLLVLDTLNRRVQRLDARGRFQEVLFSGGDGLGRPVALTVDESGNLWIFDAYEEVLRGFRADGTPLQDAEGKHLALPAASSCKTLVAGPEGALWMADPLSGAVVAVRSHLREAQR